MKAGDTFLYPFPTEHLWIVLTNPDPGGLILIVNITTAYSDDKDRVDSTVDLNPGDHPFVSDRSYVYYRAAMTKTVGELEAAEHAGRLKRHACCSESILKLVRSGIGASRHCTKAIKKFYNEHKDL